MVKLIYFLQNFKGGDMAMKFSLPKAKKKAKTPAENVDSLNIDENPTPKKKSLFAKRTKKAQPSTSTPQDIFSVDSPKAKGLKLDKKKATLLGALVGVLLIAVVVVMFVLPMLSPSNEQADIAPAVPAPTTTEPAPVEATATPDTTAPAETSATEATVAPEQPSNEAVATKTEVKDKDVEVVSVDEINKKADEAQKAEAKPAPNSQKLMEENKPKKSAEQALKEQHTMSYADFVKASEQQVFTDR